MVTVSYDGVSTTINDNLNDWTWFMGHTSMSQFHTGWWHFWRLMVTVAHDGVSIEIDDKLNDWAWYMGHIRACANFIQGGDTFQG